MLPVMWCRPSSQSKQSLPRGRVGRNGRRGFFLGARKRPLCVDSLHCLSAFFCWLSGRFTRPPQVTSGAAHAASPPGEGRRGECSASVGGPFSPAHLSLPSHIICIRETSTQPHESRTLRRWGIHEVGGVFQGGQLLRLYRGLPVTVDSDHARQLSHLPQAHCVSNIYFIRMIFITMDIDIETTKSMNMQ